MAGLAGLNREHRPVGDKATQQHGFIERQSTFKHKPIDVTERTKALSCQQT